MIMSDSAGLREIKNSPVIGTLSKIIPITYHAISHISRHNKHIGLSECQHLAMLMSAKFDSIFFIYPDFICASSTISLALNKLNEGYEAVAFPVPPILPSALNDVDFLNFVDHTSNGRFISIPPRKLVELSFKHYHPSLSGNFVGGNKKNEFLAYLQWKIGDKTWLLHCFHLHPIAFKVKRSDPNFRLKFTVSIDEEFFPILFEDANSIYFPEHSDEFAMCSISDADDLQRTYDGAIEFDDIISYAERYTGPLHRDMILQPFFWSSTHKNQILKVAEATEVISQANHTIKFIRHCLNTPNSVLALDSPRALAARNERKNAVLKRSRVVANDFIEGDDHVGIMNVHYSKPLSATAQKIINRLNQWKQRRFVQKLRRFPVAQWINRQLLNLLSN